MSSPAYLLIANPVAGKGLGAARARALAGALARDHTVELVETTARGDATALTRSRGAGADRIIAIGGDGTLNEVLAGVMTLGSSGESRPALGYLPGGTANVATAAFAFDTDPVRVARTLPTTAGRRVDVGLVEVGGIERPFLLWCGAGLDAVVIDELNSARTGRMGLAGLAAKVPRVLSAVSAYAAPAIRVTADGAELPPVSSLFVANVGQIAFGGTIHSAASASDGVLDVVTMEDASPLGVFLAGATMLFSSLTASGRVRHRTATSLTMVGDGPVPIQIDGEPIGRLPATVRLAVGAVRLLTPDPGPAAHR
ncbi:MAG: diacylglycerol kinase family protein [Gemmatimonadota bacterium]|jgi:diacylglycerol kinase (ATP)